MAVFIDLENLFGGYGGDVLGVPISRLIRGIREEVTPLGGTGSATTRAYANWSHPGMSTYRREMMENGVEPVQVWSHPGPGRDPRETRKKNAADIQLVVDALTVAGEAPWIDVFAIVSGDGDFIPLIRRLQFLGKIVIGVTIRHARAGGVSQDLRAAVDHFIDLHGGDELAAPTFAVPASADGAAGEDRLDIRPVTQAVPSNKTPSREEYIETTQRFTREYPQAMKNGDVDGAFMNGLLRRQWPRVSYSDFGFKSFGTFIEEGCGLSIFHPHASQSVLSKPSISAQHENQAGVLDRAALEEVSPQVTYPTLKALADVLTELTLQMVPRAPEDLLDLVGDELPEVPAEQIRQAFSLLFTIGAFYEDKAEGTIALSPDIASVEDGVHLVLQDAERRADTIGWDLDGQSIREAIFPGA